MSVGTWIKAVAASLGVGEPSLTDLERNLPPLPDPAGPFWVSERFVSSPLLDMLRPNGLVGVRGAPDLEAMLPPVSPGITVGMRVTDPSAPRKVYPDGRTARMERLGISLHSRPEYYRMGFDEPWIPSVEDRATFVEACLRVLGLDCVEDLGPSRSQPPSVPRLPQSRGLAPGHRRDDVERRVGA